MTKKQDYGAGRDVRVMVRLSADEVRQLKKLKKEKRFPSLSQAVRNRLFNNKGKLR